MMRKAAILALVLFAGAVFSASAANDGKKKAKKAFWEEIPVDTFALVTSSDTISYASGMAASNGVISYLERNLDFDTLFIDDFKRGFNDAIDRGGDPKYVAYNAGVQIASQVGKQIFPKEAEMLDGTADSLDLSMFYAGFLAGAMNDSTVFTVAAATDFAKQRKDLLIKQKNEAYMLENVAFLDANKEREDVVVLPSGLQYKVIEQGEGAVATVEDNVTVRYEGKMIDGTVFDSSYERDPDTSTFKPSKVIKGWTEALCMMPEGSKWELYIPQELAYGERQAGKIKPYSTLIFTVEVVKVN